ncbi:MAG: amidohydrolase family protein [Oscillospiraceae bacterium]|jgi:predicted TIM-barrel fold metal-dependent hydrolase|nr:amidohydrolase family protein [Oscillospiraceae bacterium]
MTIIDTHAHIFPAKIETVATKAIGTFYETPMSHNGSVSELLESGKRAGVTNHLVFSTATTLKQVPKINEFIIEQVAAHSEFYGAGTMFIGYEDYRFELDNLRANGVHGVKFHPDFQKFCIDEEALDPIFAYMQETGMFLITHSGDTRYTYSHPARVASVAKRFPDMRVIAAHFGGWSCWDVGRRELNLPNVYFDTSSTLGFDGNENALRAFETFDNSHIFFGDDFPMWDHAEELERVRALGLGDALLEQVLHGNFEAFISNYLR